MTIKTQSAEGSKFNVILFFFIKNEIFFKENFISNSEEFIPTDQWQIVKEGKISGWFLLNKFDRKSLGQAIPAGLHVRLNLQTGIREAKLLDASPSNDLIPVNNTQNESTINISVDRSKYSARSVWL